jgi:peroxiredoxin Q/BCP
MFTRRHRLAAAALIAVAAPLGVLRAQQPAAQQSPEVGAAAPDFTISGATRYGLLAKPVHLSDFRGKTVVLAFFYKARTKG